MCGKVEVDPGARFACGHVQKYDKSQPGPLTLDSIGVHVSVFEWKDGRPELRNSLHEKGQEICSKLKVLDEYS